VGNYHINTLKLVRIENDAIFRLGWNKKHHGRKCFSSTVARMTGEMGNEYPSNFAIRVANWLKRSLKI